MGILHEEKHDPPGALWEGKVMTSLVAVLLLKLIEIRHLVHQADPPLNNSSYLQIQWLCQVLYTHWLTVIFTTALS